MKIDGIRSIEQSGLDKYSVYSTHVSGECRQIPSSQPRKRLAYVIGVMFTGAACQNLYAALPESGFIYQLKNRQADLCVATTGATGAPVKVGECSGANSQRFTILNKGGGNFTVKTVPETGSCLAIQEGVAPNGAPILVQANCGGTPALSKQWRLVEKANGMQLVSAASGQCMVASGGVGAALVQGVCQDRADQLFTVTKFERSSTVPSESGQWSAPIELGGVVASSATLLPNGKILFWSGTGTHSFHQTGVYNTYTGTFDPATLQVSIKNEFTGHEMFCPGSVMTADGRVLVVGGGGDLPIRNHVTSYDYLSGRWYREANLAIPRWYNSATILGDGSVFSIGGDGAGGAEYADKEKSAEIWTPSTLGTGGVTGGSWRYLPNTGEPEWTGGEGAARHQYYRKVYLSTAGKLLELAPSPIMRWHSTAGDGATTVAARRMDADNPGMVDGYAQGGTTVYFEQDRVLLAGGAAAFGDEDPSKVEADVPAYNKSYIVDLATGKASSTSPMHFPRYQANGVVLPDGQVMVVGGVSRSLLFNDQKALMAPELYNPTSQRWSVLAPMNKPRIYHSTAVLLPDGRVWAAGGGQCGTCSVNQTNAEIYSPPYLFINGIRPSITAAPQEVKYGNGFQVNVSSDTNIDRFVLIRLGVTTHITNTDQRLVKLSHVGGNGTFTLAAPQNGNVAPPGYYMLFAINGRGQPSIAKMVRVA
ncbi:galactose oxidase-like domain-containing protein [Chitinivorax sp. B]|uniref:galactose oxidase-like domain-containing protein n=1 Tax=Chitinivorax sp. B TaxID=2502235 RepID=UPI002017164C|nr:galactose oxidase-like domain-containing protein [Chitinivorax sp. B]